MLRTSVVDRPLKAALQALQAATDPGDRFLALSAVGAKPGCITAAVEHQEQLTFADVVPQRVNGLAAHSGQPDVVNTARESES
jgi:hypothetical protein